MKLLFCNAVNFLRTVTQFRRLFSVFYKICNWFIRRIIEKETQKKLGNLSVNKVNEKRLSFLASMRIHYHTLRAYLPSSLCIYLAWLHSYKAWQLSAGYTSRERECRYVAEMGLDEEKTVLGDEIVSEEVKLFTYPSFL